ncbi:unnamed protein product [Durusdinium trenchii]|uniref:Uncharacterized protein n=1 Tax=Durusdinium trenchii TaxID=1381693 RepID=A0ABP0M9T4_9DINO
MKAMAKKTMAKKAMAKKPTVKKTTKKNTKAKETKGELPCSPRATMAPTGKRALCSGVNNRMTRCKGKQVKDVLWKMKYKSPKSQQHLTYNLQDLRYDLLRGYLKVKVLRAGTSAASSSKGELPCSPNATMLPTGKVALCPGVNNRMKGCKGKKVVDVVGKMGYKSPKGQLVYNVRDLKYDLLRGYVKVKLLRAPPASKATTVARGRKSQPAMKVMKTTKAMKVAGGRKSQPAMKVMKTTKAMKAPRSRAASAPTAKAETPNDVPNATSAKSSTSSSSTKGELPCSVYCVMRPTGKLAKCPGINQRMERCNGKRVQEVLNKLEYSSPKGSLTYSAQDLKYDLRCGYLEVLAPNSIPWR